MKIHNQPFDGAFGEILIDWLNNSTGEFFAISAFAKNSGTLLLEDAINNFRSRGGIVTFVVGIDLGGTSVEALKNLFRFSDNLYVIHSENNITFHHKIYALKNNDEFHLAVGSNNLTKGGLYNNYESSLIYKEVSKSSKLSSDTSILINRFVDTSNKTTMKINDEKDIQELQNNGYISLEKEIQIEIIKSRAISFKKKSNTRLFGNESFISKEINQHKISINEKNDTKKAIPSVPSYSLKQNDIFWFEAGNLTGGSRNILDLSKRGKLQSGSANETIYYLDENSVQGGVRFFGLDPETPTSKDIVINFNGSNYFPATIKYAAGNSNWRLQIKGKNDNSTPLTAAVGSDMIGQILLFEKVHDTNYIMNIIPYNHLETLKDSSLFWATNGRTDTGRKFGYIIKELEE
ncbi:hypothetical protein A5881_002302 [Enterococcus termitis]